MNIKKILTISIEILVVAFLYSQRHCFKFTDVDMIIDWIKSYGYLSFLSYLVFCIIASLFFTPLAIQRSIALIIFGPLIGGVLAVGGILLGAISCFVLSRYVLASYFKKKFENHKLYNKINTSVKKRKGLIMLSTRFNPVFSNTLQNYLYGLTELSFRDYTVWTTIMYIPGTITLALWIKLATIDNLFSRQNIFLVVLILLGILILTISIIYIKKRSRGLVDEDKD